MPLNNPAGGDEIVGKINSATANITRAGSIEGTAVSALDSDDIREGSINKYDTGVLSVIEKLTSDPSTPIDGQIWLRTDL